MSAARSGQTQVKTYLDDGLRRDIMRLATDADRSVAAEVRRALREYVARQRLSSQPSSRGGRR